MNVPVESLVRYATQDPLTIGQCWDKNQFFMSWMEKFLPESRMWQDGILSATGIFLTGYMGWVLLHLILHFDKIYVGVSLPLGAYLLVRLNIRMLRAQRKYALAKRQEKEAKRLGSHDH